MKVNERRTVVGGWLATVCPPKPWREIDATVHCHTTKHWRSFWCWIESKKRQKLYVSWSINQSIKKFLTYKVAIPFPPCISSIACFATQANTTRRKQCQSYRCTVNAALYFRQIYFTRHSEQNRITHYKWWKITEKTPKTMTKRSTRMPNSRTAITTITDIIHFTHINKAPISAVYTYRVGQK